MPTILVIDDEAVLRKTITRALQLNGFKTLEADGGNAGVELTRKHSPDLIISDVTMERGDGYEALRTLRRDPHTATIPFILITAHTDPAGIRKGMEEGADDYLLKPFTLEALLGTVQARLKKQQTLREHEERTKGRLVAILEATTDLVAIVDARTQRLQYLNRQGRAVTGIGDGADLSQFRLSDLQPSWSWELLEREGIPTAIREGVWTGETAIWRAGEKEVPVSQLMLAHKASDGSVEYVSIIARDITERKQAEERRQQMELQLRNAQKLEAIGQLAAGIAHEINTPTQYIEHNLQFVKNAFDSLGQALRQYERLLEAAKSAGLLPELVREVAESVTRADANYLIGEIPLAIDEAIHGAGRVGKIVRAMKDFSHPGVGDGERLVATDLNHMIDSTITVASNEWKYVAKMVTELDPDLPFVPVLPSEFNQVVLNLLVNAAHAIGDVVGDGSQGKGTITVSTRRDGGSVEIRIRDTGTGIPESVRHRIFDPFFTTKPVGKGTGQGLAIARSVVVEKHGGELSFETETGQGTCFIIRLPLDRGGSADSTGSYPEPAGDNTP
ncbi:MAG: response regulator [Verrucomicrobiales bacterium]|nr:response regulator [Verrucomicrobiales bacterium]